MIYNGINYTCEDGGNFYISEWLYNITIDSIFYEKCFIRVYFYLINGVLTPYYPRVCDLRSFVSVNNQSANINYFPYTDKYYYWSYLSDGLVEVDLRLNKTYDLDLTDTISVYHNLIYSSGQHGRCIINSYSYESLENGYYAISFDSVECLTLYDKSCTLPIVSTCCSDLNFNPIVKILGG